MVAHCRIARGFVAKPSGAPLTCHPMARIRRPTFLLRQDRLDTGTPSGRLMLNVFVAVGQFEREIMLERQREGIAKAKEEGRYKGRKPKARVSSR